MTRHLHSVPFPVDTDPGAVAGLVTMLTLGTAFGLAALGVSWFWVVFPVGFGGVMPVAVGAAKRRGRGRTSGSRRCERSDRRHESRTDRSPRAADEDAALARLRERYANGDLDEAAFEARLERLLLTEDTDTAREYARERRGDRETEASADSGWNDR
ncbi:SHOCT domain-containing protein [Haloglomus litoreum]|uniref:SHOCT domain-containing protein n=1 Tax=Haloglomus litoreum TaxID=3034026 RepID=UPI0023E7AFB5|nr:SHOCT domain-containing protein [Haloglomus sp. DT116]